MTSGRTGMRRISGRLAAVAITVIAAFLPAPTVASAAAPTLTWTQPTNPDPMRGWPTAIDCAAKNWCMIVDLSGLAVRRTSNGWDAPVRVETPYPDSGFYSLSCPSTTLCFAVDGAGRIARYNGHSWSTPTLINGHRAGTISCSSPTFCMSVARYFYSIFDGTSWTTSPNPMAKGRDFTSVSCVSSNFCMSVYYTNEVGNVAWVYRDHAWTRSAYLFHIGGDTLFGLSCTSSTFCMAIGDQEIAERWDGTQWHKSVRTDFSSYDPAALSCTSSHYCISVGTESGSSEWAMSSEWDGHVWHTPQRFDWAHRVDAVSCAPGTTLCRATDPSGRVSYHLAGGAWSKPSLRDPSYGDISSVACGTTRCVAVDSAGRALRSTGAGWTAPEKIDIYANFDVGGLTISCARSDFCLTVDRFGGSRRLDGTRWSTTGTAPFSPAALSCRSSTWCMAISSVGQVSIYHGSTWSAPRYSFHDASGQGLQWDLSCAAWNYCMAYSSAGLMRRYTGSGWLAPKDLGDIFDADVSCPTTLFCMATGGNFRTWRHSSTGWHALGTPAQDTPQLSCESAQFCLAAGTYGELLTYDGSAWSTSTTMSLPAYGYFESVDCTATVTFCVAVTPIDVTIGKPS